MEKKPEIVFMPGCFDDFEGTQDELDSLISEIQRMVDTGELYENAVPVDAQTIEIINDPCKRTLQ